MVLDYLVCKKKVYHCNKVLDIMPNIHLSSQKLGMLGNMIRITSTVHCPEQIKSSLTSGELYDPTSSLQWIKDVPSMEVILDLSWPKNIE